MNYEYLLIRLMNNGFSMNDALNMIDKTVTKNKEKTKMNLHLKNLKVAVLPRKIGEDDSFEPFVYLVEEYSHDDELSSITLGFGDEDKDDKDKIVVFRDKDYNILDLSEANQKEIFYALYSGINREHSSLEASSVSILTDDLPEKKKLAAKTALLNRDRYDKDVISNSISKLSTFDTSGTGLKFESGRENTNFTEKQLKAIDTQMKKTLNLFGGTIASSGAVNEDLIERYSFKKNIMFVGDAGEGKTFMLTQWIDRKVKEDGYTYFHADGHEGFEIPDMLGMMVPNETGGMSWIDGPVTQAFRSAARGNKTVLVMDEILRIPDKERSMLIGSLVPKADGYLSLRTNRIQGYDEDGVGDTEEIKCLPENLWVAAASNIGTGFSVDDMDTAFQDRFRTFRVENGSVLIKIIADSLCAKKGFPKALSRKIVELYETFHEIKKKGSLQKNFSARHVSEILTMSNEISDIGRYLEDLTYTCLSINSSGRVNEAEKDIWDTLIEPFTSM